MTYTLLPIRYEPPRSLWQTIFRLPDGFETVVLLAAVACGIAVLAFYVGRKDLLRRRRRCDDVAEEILGLIRTGSAGRARSVLSEVGGVLGAHSSVGRVDMREAFGSLAAAKFVLKLLAVLGLCGSVWFITSWLDRRSLSWVPMPFYSWIKGDPWFVLPLAVITLLTISLLRHLSGAEWWTENHADQLLAQVEQALRASAPPQAGQAQYQG